MDQVKALALFSGGLDSTLAAKVVASQGVYVQAIYFVNAFLAGYKQNVQQDSCPAQVKIAQGADLPLHIVDISRPHLEIVQNPRYGYGGHMNPCIDCRIFMLQRAKTYMQQQGFSFIVSGEVLGQRPMSQRRDTLNIIERDSGCKGLVLRPLSAKLLKPTLAEEKGWIDRDKLYAFSGRTRKPQLALAKKLGIKEYLTPAGGCLLTEAEFVRKFQDLSVFGKVDVDEIQLLKIGRHFYYGGEAKIIVGRNEEENKHLNNIASSLDILMKMRDFSGPLTVVRKNGPSVSDQLIKIAAEVTARYSKGKDEGEVWVEYWTKQDEKKHAIVIKPASPVR